MILEEKEKEYLFSYGTLQTEAVQRATFGRRLEGHPDELIGYRLRMIQIKDQDFVALSGSEQHRAISFTGHASDTVNGTALKVSEQELVQADGYEPSGYKRVLVTLRSGVGAWVYVNDEE